MTKRDDSTPLPEDVAHRVERARAAGPWEAPPQPLVDEVVAAPAPNTPGPGANPATVSWQPSDVRSAGVLIEGGRVLSEIFSEGELGITADPPGRGGTREIRGKIWLRDSDSPPSTVLLLQGDHVVATVEVQSGESFTISEILSPGWTLEVHLPSGRTVRVVDPEPETD